MRNSTSHLLGFSMVSAALRESPRGGGTAVLRSTALGQSPEADTSLEAARQVGASTHHPSKLLLRVQSKAA